MVPSRSPCASLLPRTAVLADARAVFGEDLPTWQLKGCVEGRSDCGYVGIANEGATCFLNSLLQGLYMTAPFRAQVHARPYSEEADGPRDTCIPWQIQLLFAALQQRTCKVGVCPPVCLKREGGVLDSVVVGVTWENGFVHAIFMRFAFSRPPLCRCRRFRRCLWRTPSDGPRPRCFNRPTSRSCFVRGLHALSLSLVVALVLSPPRSHSVVPLSAHLLVA